MKFLKTLAAAILIFSTLAFTKIDDASAATNISIYLNDTKQSYSDKAMIKNGATLVPLRGIFEGLGAQVTWNASTKTIDATKGSTKVWLKIGSTTTKVDGKNVSIAVPAQVVNGSTLVPLRFISESLGAQVEWVQATQTIKIVTGDSTSPKPPTTAKKNMKVHFIDVGQGDATLLQLATGENVLVDAGTDAAGEKVVAYLKSLKISNLDYVIATHPDADHIGGMVDVLNAFKVDTFIDSGKVHTSKTYENTLIAVQKEGSKYIVPESGQIFEYNQSIESYFQILNVDEFAAETNDASIVVKGGYCNKDFLLMGDASTTVESKIVRGFDNLEVEILKAGHHGSNTSSSLSFLKAVNPEAVILSYGEGNSYGHPHQDVLSNIKAVGAKAYSTAQDGTIVATINCDGYKLDSKEFVIPNDVNKPEPRPEPKPEPKPEEPGDVNSGDYVVPGASTSFANCTDMRKVYPSGVKSWHPAYAGKHDRDGDGWACEPYDDGEEVKLPPVTPTPPPVTTPPSKTYKNCTELKKDYPGGVKRGHPAYESKMDRDGDGHACE